MSGYPEAAGGESSLMGMNYTFFIGKCLSLVVQSFDFSFGRLFKICWWCQL